jgi:hypothetical protein
MLFERESQPVGASRSEEAGDRLGSFGVDGGVAVPLLHSQLDRLRRRRRHEKLGPLATRAPHLQVG